jgi:hypothetical protein
MGWNHDSPFRTCRKTNLCDPRTSRHDRREPCPEDFMSRLTAGEAENLRSQIATSSLWGGRRYLPDAFTEQGIAMLSSVLESPMSAISDRVRDGSLSPRYNINNDVASP